MGPDTGGYTKRMFVSIRPRYRDDEGIHAHELTHVKQWYRNPICHCSNYSDSRRLRLNYEVEAFVAQILSYPEEERESKIKRFAYFLANKYDLRILEIDAENKLRKALDD